MRRAAGFFTPKTAMQKIVLFAGGSLAALVLLANLNGALPENTAAPGELTCGRPVCHNIPANTGDAQITITFADSAATYQADSTYLVRVGIQNPQTIRNGFQIVALRANNQNAGAWILTDPDKTKIIPGIGLPSRRYVTHLAAGNAQTEWTMRWKAPANASGPVTFYASVLSANNNAQNTGDEVYTTQRTVELAAPSAAGEPPAPEIRTNWTSDGVRVEAPAGTGPMSLFLYDSGGGLAATVQQCPDGACFLNAQHLPAGFYFLVVRTRGGRTVKKGWL